MGTVEILLISVGLAMDAFAVSVCKGLSMKKMNWKKAIIIGLYFIFTFYLFLYLNKADGLCPPPVQDSIKDIILLFSLQCKFLFIKYLLNE